MGHWRKVIVLALLDFDKKQKLKNIKSQESDGHTVATNSSLLPTNCDGSEHDLSSSDSGSQCNKNIASQSVSSRGRLRIQKMPFDM